MAVLDALKQVRSDGGTFFVLPLRFGGGINAASEIDQIAADECVSGSNFDISLDQTGFRPRKAINLLATTTNASRINGFIEHIRPDGSSSLCVQSGDTVYKWDGGSTFTSVATVSSASRLRGSRRASSALDDFVIVTDLGMQTVVKTWDGSTFADHAHNLATPFFAKYCLIEKERAFFANVMAGLPTPHLIVGSKRSDVTTLSISDRPSSALAEDDPFFIPTPDLRPVNGIVSAFKQHLFSTQDGQIFVLTGESAQDFAIDEFYPDSAAAGEEAIVFTGNDVMYGRVGRIESLLATDRFGDVETSDPGRWISPSIASVTAWQAVFNPRTNRGFFFPRDGNEVFVFNKSIFDIARTLESRQVGVSPWSRYTTTFGDADFRVTAAQTMRSPIDGRDYVYFGDTAGRIFIMEGTAGADDGGSAAITAFRVSGLIDVEPADVYDVKGYIKYEQQTTERTVTLTFMHNGITAFDQAITVTIPAATEGAAYWGGAFYFGGEIYFGQQFSGRIKRQRFSGAGRSSGVQVKISAAPPFAILELGLEFRPAT